jgi:cytochrome c553
MRTLALLLALSAAVAGCGDGKGPAMAEGPRGDAAAGRAFAERECKGCHGLDGKGAAPAIPHLAAQRERYLLAALTQYRQGRRPHAALKDIATRMSEADARNLAAFYSSLPPVRLAAAAPVVSPYEEGKRLAEACAKCHGADGNGTLPGIPTLAGQQPHYLVLAINEYLNRERKAAPMHGLLPALRKRDMEALALYFASQQPAPRATPPIGDAKAGEPLTAVCGGCHGAHGVSGDAATPTLASQDARYLVDAIKAYRTSRQRENMRKYISELPDRDIVNIAAFYAAQKSYPAEKGQALLQDLTGKCERCHGADGDKSSLAIPHIRGQDRDYLVMALRAYRDDRRESTAMHRMSLPYSDAIIESLASVYASQPPR